MSGYLLAIFWIECLAVIGWGFLKRERLLSFPLLAAGVFAAFLGIPLVGVVRSAMYPDATVSPVLIMAILSLAGCWLGFKYASPASPPVLHHYSEHRLRLSSGLLTLIGITALLGIKALPEELTKQSQWTGSPVAYLFFAQILAYGLAIAMMDLLKTGSKFSLVLVVLGVGFYLDRIILEGRRGPAAEFLSILSCSIWFARGWTPPRWLAVLSLGLLVAALYGTAEYRSAVVQAPERRWSDVAEIQPSENVQVALERGTPEIEIAIMSIDATSAIGSYDLGLFHWNTLVFNYVPAQLFGEQFKSSLTVPLPDVAYAVHGFVGRPGATSTGLVDAFHSFWYFGALKFVGIGLVMGWLLRRAQVGGLGAQIVYMLMLTNSLHAVTHHTQWFVSPWLHMAFFLLPCLWFARLPRSTRNLKPVARLNLRTPDPGSGHVARG